MIQGLSRLGRLEIEKTLKKMSAQHRMAPLALAQETEINRRGISSLTPVCLPLRLFSSSGAERIPAAMLQIGFLVSGDKFHHTRP